MEHKIPPHLGEHPPGQHEKPHPHKHEPTHADLMAKLEEILRRLG